MSHEKFIVLKKIVSSGFMEIEACGGCSEELTLGTELRVGITTKYLMV